MSAPATPNALRRLFRDRSRLIAVLLLAIVALSASGIQSAASVQLQRTLDANWRGAYDILVTAEGNTAGTSGLLAPNSLASADKGMSLADVAKVRMVSGIDVAAPIGEVDVSQLSFGTPSISIPQNTAGADTVPQAFKLTTTYTTNDGINSRYVAGGSSTVVIDETPKPPARPAVKSCNLNDFDVDITKYPALCGLSYAGYDNYGSFVTVQSGRGFGSGDEVENGVIHFGAEVLNGAPQGSTRITLVDPVAERRLLGSDAAFLQPLIALAPTATTSESAMVKWAASSRSSFAKSFLAQKGSGGQQLTPDQAEYQRQLAAFEKEHGLNSDAGSAPAPAYVPLITAPFGAAPLTVSVKVDRLGPAPRTGTTDGSFPFNLPTGAPSETVGTTTVDATGLLNPFAKATVDIDWPGTKSAPRLNAVDQTLRINATGTIGTPDYTVAKGSDSSVAASISAPGFIDPRPVQGGSIVNPFALTKDGTVAGVESAYSPATLIAQAQGAIGQIAVPVGSFSTKKLSKLQSSLSYVPLGAYQEIGSTVIANGKTHKLNPSITGLGLVSPRTIAIASISSAPAWHQNTPVTAIRVRVSGITAYTPQSQQKVVDVAQAIQKLGFTATIVAGSSPTAVDLTVKNYAFGVANANAKQRVGTLGNITQQWSELGAAARADIAVSTASLSVLGIALGSTALLLVAVQFASIPRRRAQSAVMRDIGWPRSRVRRWMAAEEIPGLLIVLLAGLAATWLSGLSRVSIVICGVGIAVVITTSIAAVVLGSSRPALAYRNLRAIRPSGRRQLHLRGRTTITFGLRQAGIHSLTSITQVLAVLIVALSAAGLAEVFLEGQRHAGSSLLAQFTTGQAAALELVLAVVALTSGIILAVLARRVDLARRAPQWAAMRAMGWPSRDLRSSQRAEAVFIAIPAILLSAATAWTGCLLIGAVAPVALISVAGIAAVLTSLSLLLVRRKATAL